jgi:hypothetical protein
VLRRQIEHALAQFSSATSVHYAIIEAVTGASATRLALSAFVERLKEHLRRHQFANGTRDPKRNSIWPSVLLELLCAHVLLYRGYIEAGVVGALVSFGILRPLQSIFAHPFP